MEPTGRGLPLPGAPGCLSLALTAMDLEGQRHDYFGALEWAAGPMRAATPGQMGRRPRASSSRCAT